MKQQEKNWPPATGSYDDPDKRPRCRHRTKPSEPFARERQHGSIARITPAARGIPAQALVDWEGEFTTWEKLTDLAP